MQSDRFEELLRKKLENYTPDYREEDLDRMFNNIQRHTSPSFWSQYGKIFSYSLAGIITAGLLFTLFFQYNQNQKLHEEIALLKNRKPTTQTITQTIVKTDTVYRTQYITVFEKQENEAITAQPLKQQAESEQVMQLKVIEGDVLREKPQSSFQPTEARKQLDKVAERNEKKFEKTEIEANETKPKVVLETHQSDVPANQTEKVVLPSTVQPTESPFVFKEVVVNELIIRPLREYSADYSLEKQIINYRIKSYSAFLNKKPKRPRYDYDFPDFSLKNTKYRLGIGTTFGHEKIGLSLNNEWLLNKHFSLNFGAGITQIDAKDFDSDRDYDRLFGKDGIVDLPDKGEKNNQDFRDRHFPSLPPDGQIRDIHLVSEIINVPLGITYRGTIRNDWKWLTTVGTSLDLYVKEKVRFGFHIDNPSYPRNDFIESNDSRILQPMLFNNVWVASGVEKSWKSLVFQATPYLLYRHKEANYRPEKYDFGFRFNVLYQF